MEIRVTLILLVAGMLGHALAAEPPPIQESWMVETNDGKSVFVMLTPNWICKTEEDGNGEGSSGKRLVGYSVSGLYPKGDKTHPIYTVGWYDYRVDLSNDGRYLVRPAPVARYPSDQAVAFYDRGRLIRKYSVDDLVPFWDPFEDSGSYLMWEKSRKFDTETNELSIETRYLNTFRFDVTTGEIKSSFRGDYIVLSALAVLFFSVIAFVVVKLSRRSRVK